ncbi:MAG: DJ-1/PfpI family protein [Myxococcota bacterium]
MHITIVVYPGVTMLDAVGPAEVLTRLPEASVTVASLQPGEAVRSDTGVWAMQPDAAIADVASTDLLLVPGGPLTGTLAEDAQVAASLQRLHASASVTASVCTGSLLLGAAGILRGVRATTHWACLDELEALGAVPVRERVVVDGSIYTAAGVSSGIDMALRLTADLQGEALARRLQLAIEYDPQPPFDSGSPRTADPALVESLRRRFATMAERERG